MRKRAWKSEKGRVRKGDWMSEKELKKAELETNSENGRVRE